MSKRNAVRQAINLLNKYNINDVPVSVEELCESEGIKVVYETLDDDTSAVIVIRDNRAVIGVNNDHHPNRQRFSMAHELAHFILHRDEKDIFVDKRLYRNRSSATGEDLIEIEANNFAAELLMPQDIIYRIEENIGTIDLYDDKLIGRLASRFQVSEQALTIRLMNLGYK